MNNNLLAACLLFISISALFISKAEAEEVDGQLWFQAVMYVHHYDRDWDWVEGFDNKVVGLEYRKGAHGFGAQTFINSFGGRTYGAHYSNSYYFGNGFNIGATAGINHGYESEYIGDVYCNAWRTDGGCSNIHREKKRQPYIGAGFSLATSLHASYQYEGFELSLMTLGVSAAALKFSMQVF